LGLHYDNLFKSAVLINLTHKKTFFKKRQNFSRFSFGTTLDTSYYIEQGFNLSFGFKSQFNQFNRNVAKEISSLDLGSLGINSINVDFQDVTNQAIFNPCLSINFFSRWRAELKYLKLNQRHWQM
jgi:NTE family protein